MKTKILILSIIVLLAVFIAGAFILKSHNNDHTKAKTIVMDVGEYLNDGIYEKNYTTHEFHLEYRSLDPGDILIIKDKIIQKPKYGFDDVTKRNVTRLTIGGNTTWPIVIYVDRDVTNKYKMGDLIEIKLHIKHYDFYEEWNNATWHIWGEFPKEAIIDGKYSGEIIVPASQVKKVG
ncbi:MAG: hypothetical protein FE045_01870 [Thermoplasmata archaeon]|nr:MAG: hypothetical protein FE045_01870 [Thermoplasmata archaeon]MCD6222565.1 hypothetical protein [Thermoplasmata archaeon]